MRSKTLKVERWRTIIDDKLYVGGGNKIQYEGKGKEMD